MTQHFPTRQLRFFLTAPSPCPYLPGRHERKVFAHLPLTDGAGVNDSLTQVGFRRSQNIAYRPACTGCAACVPVRVVVGGFVPGRGLRRIAARNDDVAAVVQPNRGTPEQYQLFTRYLESRHGDGEMVGMRFHEYRSMVEDSPIDTRLVEFRDGTGQLIACCLADWAADGISAVYSFFDTSAPRRTSDA